MPPKRMGRRYGRGVNKRGTKYGYLKSKRRGGYRKRRVGVVRRRKRYGKNKRKRFVRRRKTKGMSFPKYGQNTPSRFQKQLAIAQGNIYLARRQVQCEWQCPPAKTTGGAINFNPSIYCYPRPVLETVSLERERMIYPFDNADLWKIYQQRLYPSDTGTNPYQVFVMIKYRAVYEIRNQSNYKVDYHALKFKVKRNIPYVPLADPAVLEQSWINPWNVAGNFVQRTGEGSGGGIADASHQVLHKISCEVQKIPPFQYAFSCKKKPFSLSPGQTRKFVITGYRQFKKIDLVGAEIEGGTITHVKNDHWAGSQFIAFKMMSAPADWNAAETSVWTSSSTRTVPSCLLSYQIEYQVRQPIVNQANNISTIELGTWGFAENDDNSKVQNMGNEEMKSVAEIDLI